MVAVESNHIAVTQQLPFVPARHFTDFAMQFVLGICFCNGGNTSALLVRITGLTLRRIISVQPPMPWDDADTISDETHVRLRSATDAQPAIVISTPRHRAEAGAVTTGLRRVTQFHLEISVHQPSFRLDPTSPGCSDADHRQISADAETDRCCRSLRYQTRFRV